MSESSGDEAWQQQNPAARAAEPPVVPAEEAHQQQQQHPPAPEVAAEEEVEADADMYEPNGEAAAAANGDNAEAARDDGGAGDGGEDEVEGGAEAEAEAEAEADGAAELEPEDEVDPLSALTLHDLHGLFRLWTMTHTQTGFDPEPILTRLSELIEVETDIYMRKDPDPFDERHPSRTDPDCQLGRMLKLLFRKDNFMTRLVGDYLRDNFFTRQNVQRSSLQLNIAACRLILVIMPGLETSAVFQAEFDTLIHRLYQWAEHAEEPLCSYATGLLAAAMEVQDIAIGFREQNTRLITIMLRRLHVKQAQWRLESRNSAAGPSTTSAAAEAGGDDVEMVDDAPTASASLTQRPFPHLGGGSAPSSPDAAAAGRTNGNGGAAGSSSSTGESLAKFANAINLSKLFQQMPAELGKPTGESAPATEQPAAAEPIYIRANIPIHPPTIATSQMLILRYLTSMGEYQEFLGNVFEANAMQLLYGYIGDLDHPSDACLAFEALKYLASLLCHKKCALEFIMHGGLERLLRVPRPSIAATGVSIALYYLAYCEDAMERICLMSPRYVSEVVTYAMWLLGSTHDSARCHATMFFGLAFQFKVILDEFDRQDGLRKLFNVISTLPILNNEEHTLNDDEECAARQLVRHVCVALKKYMESHLFYKCTQITRLNASQSELLLAGSGVAGGSGHPAAGAAHFVFRAPKCTSEQMSEQVRTLQELLPYRARWEPVHGIVNLNAIALLLRIIAYSYEWNYSGSTSHRAETVRSALEVLVICCVIPKVHTVFCDRMDLPAEGSAAGINIILGAAEGEIVADAEVQKAALTVLTHIVCAPIVKPLSIGRYGSARKKSSNKHSEELIIGCWESVRNNNGIIVLLSLMETKTPITDADCIRGMACHCLGGLARSETIRQIISKLPLFTNGQLQALMRDPILQEKRTEHVQFQKYALELMERVSGKSNAHNQMDASLANIHRANVVAHTKISFNDTQLHELIHAHLMARGLHDTAASLQREAGLQLRKVPATPKPKALVHSPFAFRSPIGTQATSRWRARHNRLGTDFNATLNAVEPPPAPPAAAEPTAELHTTGAGNGSPDPDDAGAEAAAVAAALCTPIKLIKKQHPATPQSLPAALAPQTDTHKQRSLQKQITASAAAADAQHQLVQQQQQQQQASASQSHVSLETIITEYLTNQHALCKNPMSTCPQFDLFVPHKCPDPRPNRLAANSANFAGRHFRRQGGTQSRRFDRRLVHSNFCVARTLRSPADSDCFFTACEFTPCASSLIVGSYSGEVRVFNINECSEEYSFNCHESFVNNIQSNREGTLIVTSCAWNSPSSTLWNIENKQFALRWSFDDEEYMEFSNVVQDRLLGTKTEMATVYDVQTGAKLLSFEPEIYNQYSKNRATFCPTDELILSDGVLWDVRSKTALHKFDKLNQTVSGVFHPNGLEVVSNTEVWDLRTFHLLRTVPTLDQCKVAFSPLNVMYGITNENEGQMDLEAGRSYDSSFKTLDAYDFTSIATVDVKRNIYDLAVNKYGSQIAIVENQGGYESTQESVVRVYGVGRKKNAEDEADEDENDMEMSDEESNSDNGSNIFAINDRNGDRGERRRRLRDALMQPYDEDDEGNWIPISSSSSSSDDDSASSNSDSSFEEDMRVAQRHRGDNDDDDDDVPDNGLAGAMARVVADDVARARASRRGAAGNAAAAAAAADDAVADADDAMWVTDSEDND